MRIQKMCCSVVLDKEAKIGYFVNSIINWPADKKSLDLELNITKWVYEIHIPFQLCPLYLKNMYCCARQGRKGCLIY